MNAEKYSVLDGYILNVVKRGSAVAGRPLTFANIHTGEVKREAIRLKIAGDRAEAFRIVDRRLQALRKAGKIEFKRFRGWVIPE